MQEPNEEQSIESELLKLIEGCKHILRLVKENKEQVDEKAELSTEGNGKVEPSTKDMGIFLKQWAEKRSKMEHSRSEKRRISAVGSTPSTPDGGTSKAHGNSASPQARRRSVNMNELRPRDTVHTTDKIQDEVDQEEQELEEKLRKELLERIDDSYPTHAEKCTLKPQVSQHGCDPNLFNTMLGWVMKDVSGGFRNADLIKFGNFLDDESVNMPNIFFDAMVQNLGEALDMLSSRKDCTEHSRGDNTEITGCCRKTTKTIRSILDKMVDKGMMNADDVICHLKSLKKKRTEDCCPYSCILAARIFMWDTMYGPNTKNSFGPCDVDDDDHWELFCHVAYKFCDTKDMDKKSSHKIKRDLYQLVEAACFFSQKAETSPSEEYKHKKKECIDMIQKLFESTHGWSEILGLEEGKNPLGDKKYEPLALALHFELGEVMSLPQAWEVIVQLWFDELYENLFPVETDVAAIASLGGFCLLLLGGLKRKVHSSLYRKVPALLQLNEMVFWGLLLAMTYWSLWYDNPDHLDEFDIRHYSLFLLGFGFLFQEFKSVCRSGFHFLDFWNGVDLGILLLSFAWLYYKVMLNEHLIAYWILCVNSIFMLFRLLRYMAVMRKDDSLVPAMVEFIKDVFQFLRIYFLILWGFAIVMNCVFFQTDQFGNIYDSLLHLFVSTLGAFELEWFYDHPAQNLGEILLCIFLVLSAILLFNMLIAVVTKTFDSTEECCRQKWSLMNAYSLHDCQQAHGDPSDYQVVTNHLPPPFTPVSFILGLFGETVVGDLVCYVIDVFCTIAVLFLPFAVFDLATQFFALEFRAVSCMGVAVRCLIHRKEFNVDKICSSLVRALAMQVIFCLFSVAYPAHFLWQAVQPGRNSRKRSLWSRWSSCKSKKQNASVSPK